MLFDILSGSESKEAIRFNKGIPIAITFLWQAELLFHAGKTIVFRRENFCFMPTELLFQAFEKVGTLLKKRVHRQKNANKKQRKGGSKRQKEDSTNLLQPPFKLFIYKRFDSRWWQW